MRGQRSWPEPIGFTESIHSGIGERGQHAVAGGEIAIGVDRLQTDMGGAGRKMRPQAAPAPLIPKFAKRGRRDVMRTSESEH